jgi:hypothetical protein
MYGFKQIFIVKRLSEECRRTTLRSLSAGRWIVVRGYEDDWDSAVIRSELLLHFQPAHPGQTQIENQTIRLALATRPKEPAEEKISDSKQADMTSLLMTRHTAFSSVYDG